MMFVIGATAPFWQPRISNTDALNDLRKTHQTVKWRSQPIAVADVLCEGKPGTVILGSEKNDVVVGVVSGLREHTRLKCYRSRLDRAPKTGSAPFRFESRPTR
jgi:hypothetical protein